MMAGAASAARITLGSTTIPMTLIKSEKVKPIG